MEVDGAVNNDQSSDYDDINLNTDDPEILLENWNGNLSDFDPNFSFEHMADSVHYEHVPADDECLDYINTMHPVTLTLNELVSDFHQKDIRSELKGRALSTPGKSSTMYFYADRQIEITPTIKFLIEDDKALHLLVVLDHIAMSIDCARVARGCKSVLAPFHVKRDVLNNAFTDYLNQHYTKKIILLNHANPIALSQLQMVNQVIENLKGRLTSAWQKCGGKKSVFLLQDSQTDAWIKTIHTLLIADAHRVDNELGNGARPGKLIMFSEHLMKRPNSLMILLGIKSVLQRVTALEVDSRRTLFSLQGHARLPLPENIIVATQASESAASATASPSSLGASSTSLSGSSALHATIANVSMASKRARTEDMASETPTATSDSAYWARIDPQHLTNRAWCQPGMVVGIYPTGAGPPSERALFVCVVTSRPSFLELPQPFVGAEQNPVGLYLGIALAVGVLGRVPVRMEADVLARFHKAGVHKAGVSQELFWTARGGIDGKGCVDFAEDNHPIDYETAKYIGFADFDKSRFDEFGKLKTDFHDVPGVHVMVAYRAVSETQINARIANVRQLIYGLYFALFLLLSSLTFWYLLHQSSVAPVVINTTQDMRFAHVVTNTNTTLNLQFARNFKNGTTIHSSIPNVPIEFLLRPELSTEIYSAMFETYKKCRSFPELPTPVLAVVGPGGNGKSTQVHSLVQQREVYEQFTGGVYHLECSYHFGNEKKLLEDLATQMFGSFRSYNDPAELVKAMGHAVASLGEQILVVLDNVGTTHIVQSVAKVVGENGVVLVTSRRRTFPGGAALIEVHELRGKELLSYLEAHKVSVNGSRSANIDTVIARTHGVPLALTLVSKLHVVLGMPWEEIAARIDSRFGEVGTHDVEEPERLGIESAFQQSTFACIAVSVDMLSAHLKEKFIALVLLPVGMQVPARVVGAIWGISYPSSHLNSLYDHSLVVYDGDEGVVRLHDYVREYLEHIVRTNATASVTVHRRFEALMSYLLSSDRLGPLVAKAKDLNAEIGASYYRHWEYLNNVLHPGANDSVQHLTAFEHVRAHSAQLQQSAPYSLQRCNYAYESSLALRVIGKATSLEMDLIDESMRNVDEAVELHITPVDGSLPQLRACQAELIVKYADLMTSVQGSSMTALQKREKQLQLYLQARELKRDTIGSETRKYIRTLNSIGLIIEQILALHKESHSDVETFNVTLLQLAKSTYTESLDILSRLIVQKKADWLHVGVVYNNLANMESKLGNYKVVEPYLLQAIEFYRRPLVYLEPSNTYADLIVYAEANIGINCYYMNDFARAKELLTRAQEYFVKRIYPSNHAYNLTRPNVKYIVKMTKHLKFIEDLEKSDRRGYN